MMINDDDDGFEEDNFSSSGRSVNGFRMASSQTQAQARRADLLPIHDHIHRDGDEDDGSGAAIASHQIHDADDDDDEGDQQGQNLDLSPRVHAAGGGGGGGNLKRVLGWPDLLSLGIGGTIGAGIFVVTGVVAHDKAGPALCLSYLLAAFVCILAALSYAEFATLVPNAGSAYAYISHTLPEVVGWIVGWDLCLEYTIMTACVAQGWSNHFNVVWALVFGSPLASIISKPPIGFDAATGHLFITGGLVDLPAVFVMCFVITLAIVGVKKSSNVNAVVVAIKLIVVLFVIIAGAFYFNNDHFTPFLPYGFASFSLFGYSFGGVGSDGRPVGVLAGASVVFFAYMGFDMVACQAEEAKKPQRDLPIAIVGSVLISSALYIGVSVVLIGMVSYQDIDVDAPITSAFAKVGLSWAEPLIAIGALLGMTSVLLVNMMAQPRILLAISRDGLLPSQPFACIHPKYHTPHNNTAITGIAALILASFFPYSLMVRLVNIGVLMAFAVVCISIPILRHTQPNVRRAFKVPYSPYLPILGALCCLLLAFSLEWVTWIRLFGWMVIGLAVYFGYGRHHSTRNTKNTYRSFKQEDDIELRRVTHISTQQQQQQGQIASVKVNEKRSVPNGVDLHGSPILIDEEESMYDGRFPAEAQRTLLGRSSDPELVGFLPHSLSVSPSLSIATSATSSSLISRQKSPSPL